MWADTLLLMFAQVGYSMLDSVLDYIENGGSFSASFEASVNEPDARFLAQKGRRAGDRLT